MNEHKSGRIAVMVWAEHCPVVDVADHPCWPATDFKWHSHAGRISPGILSMAITPTAKRFIISGPGPVWIPEGGFFFGGPLDVLEWDQVTTLAKTKSFWCP